MISISMQALIDHLLNHPADEWSDWSCQEKFSPKMQGFPGDTWLHQAAVDGRDLQ